MACSGRFCSLPLPLAGAGAKAERFRAVVAIDHTPRAAREASRRRAARRAPREPPPKRRFRREKGAFVVIFAPSQRVRARDDGPRRGREPAERGHLVADDRPVPNRRRRLPVDGYTDVPWSSLKVRTASSFTA